MGFEPDLAQTEGGEALSIAGIPTIRDAAERRVVPATDARWYALWTRSHCERLVYDQIVPRGFEAFLPTVEVWSRRAGVRHRIQVPMFPSYLFVHHDMDKHSYIEVQKTRGLVRVLGERWDRLAPIPDEEIDAVQAVLEARVSVLPHAYLREGQRVRITRGPLTDGEGVLVRQNPKT